jgi:hypothetical protein
MSDPNQQPDPQALQPMDLGGLMKLLGTRAANSGVGYLTVLPGFHDMATQGLENLAALLLPPAVSGAMRDARQYVESAPGIRMHRYEDVAPVVAQTTGIAMDQGLPPRLTRLLSRFLPSAQPFANGQDAGNLQQFLPSYTAPASWPIPNWSAGSYGRQF